MLKLNKIGDWADDLKDKTVSKVKKASNSIGDWLDKTYNNKETASILKMPKLNLDSPFGNDPYGEKSNKITTLPYYSGNPYSEKSNNIKTLPNPYESSGKSKTGNGSYASKAIYKSSPKAPKQYANQADYEKDKRKTTTVENIQKSLNTLGYTYGDEGELKVDGDFGIKTQSNWNDFNSDRGSENFLANIGDKISDTYKDAKDNIKNGMSKFYDKVKVGYQKLNKNEVISKSIESAIITSAKAIPALKGVSTILTVNKGMEDYAKATGQTVILGLQGSAAAGAGFAGSIGYAVSPDGEKGYVISYGGGGGTPNLVSGGLFVTSSNAKEIEHLDSEKLEDLMLATGGSVGLPSGPSLGYEYGYGKFAGDDDYESYNINNHTGSLTASLFKIPVEMHGNVMWSQAGKFFDKKDNS